jgi:hypothetical protein
MQSDLQHDLHFVHTGIIPPGLDYELGDEQRATAERIREPVSTSVIEIVPELSSEAAQGKLLPVDWSPESKADSFADAVVSMEDASAPKEVMSTAILEATVDCLPSGSQTEDATRSSAEEIAAEKTKHRIPAAQESHQKIVLDQDIACVFPLLEMVIEMGQLQVQRLGYLVTELKRRRDAAPAALTGSLSEVVQDHGQLAVVRGSTAVGCSPTHPNLWDLCGTCHNYGPWNGAKCISCGNWSDCF